MRKLFILFLFIIMIQENSNAQYFQNESWSTKSNLDISSSSYTRIDDFFFADDGTFLYNCGYSSGTYHFETYWGRYKYNSASNIITFDIAGAYARGIPNRGLMRVLPDSMIVLLQNKDSVVIKESNLKRYVHGTYIRTKHDDMSKESWLYTNGDTSHCFTFYKSGVIKPTDCYYEYHDAERSFVSYAHFYIEGKTFRLVFDYIKGVDYYNNMCQEDTCFTEFDIVENNRKTIKLKRRQREQWRNGECNDLPFRIEETIEFTKK